MAIDWSLARQPNPLAMMMQGYDEGVKLRREKDTRNAMNALLADPNDTTALGSLGEADPEMAFKFKSQQANLAAQQREQQQAQMQQSGRLLRIVKADPSKYGQARAAAIQMGIPAQSIPEAYDPAWVDQQVMIADAFEKDGGQQISGLARELQDAGYRPGTPEFTKAMGIALQGKYAPQYTDAQGNVRMGSLPKLPDTGAPSPQPAQPQEALSFGQFKAYADIQGLPKAAEWARQNGMSIRVSTPQEAEQLPRGTRIILPDGSEGVVP